MNPKVIGILGVLVVAAAIYGWQNASSQQAKPQPSTVTIAALEARGIYLTLPAQGADAISRQKAEQVAIDNGFGGKVKSSFMAQLRDQKGVPGPKGPVGFVGPVWVVELDPATTGLGQPFGGPRSEDGTLIDTSFETEYSLVFIDARNGDFLFSTTLSHPGGGN